MKSITEKKKKNLDKFHQDYYLKLFYIERYD